MQIHLQKIKPWILPFAMIAGAVFHNSIGALRFLAPYLIFVMLLITYCKVRPRELKLTPMSWHLLAVQLLGALGVYLALRGFDEVLAQGTMICVLCPTATAAPVITGMLGGSVPRLAAFSLVSNMAVALLAPLLFTYIGDAGAATGFLRQFSVIGVKVGPLIIGPLLLAFLLLAFWPKAHRFIGGHQSLSFYIWALSLIIVVGNAVSFVIKEPASEIGRMLLLAVLAAVVCVLQFVAGRYIGRRDGDCIASAQGLGQKNTVLAIWMALTYLDPVSSVAPAAYVAWQNIINSTQLYLKEKAKQKDIHKC